jgi:predicted amidophosphoribosyltransferase
MNTELSTEPAKPFVPVQRWYDMDAPLSELVHTLETLSPNCQSLFAYLVKQTCDRIIKIRGREFIRNLDWTIFMGLIKSKRSRRWYDQEATLHVALNTLYSLSNADKSLVGRELSTPAQLVQRYEHYCQSTTQAISLDVVQSIIETCIKEGPEKAQEVYSVFH